jgi:outer membrane protein assembly factor BamB
VLTALRAGASGKVALAPGKQSSDFVAWSLPITGNRMASPLVYQNCLYVLEQRGGIVRCLDVATGKEHYRRRAQGASGFVASPMAADGKVYCVDQDGRTTVLEAGPKVKHVSSNELGEMCWATAGVAGNRLLIRTVDHLYCIGE